MSISSLILLLLIMSIVLFVYGVVQKSKAAKRIALWPLRRIGRIGRFCRVSHRLYVTTAKAEHAVLCVRLCVCGDSDGDHWGRWGSRSRPQGLALGDRSRRISLSCLIYHFWASKLFLKKAKKVVHFSTRGQA